MKFISTNYGEAFQVTPHGPYSGLGEVSSRDNALTSLGRSVDPQDILATYIHLDVPADGV
jgi:hypothetical protein